MGPRELSNAHFHNETLEELLLGPGAPPGSVVSMRDCSFIDCVVLGQFRVAAGVVLENVWFENIRAPDSLTISAQAVLSNVTVKGRQGCAGLWVKPSNFSTEAERQQFEDWAVSNSKATPLMLDFSGLSSAEVEVVGLPLEKLRWNAERHAALRLERVRSDTWSRLKIGPTSFWRLRAKRLQVFGAKEGVFSLPLESQKIDAQSMEETFLLRREGIVE